MILIDLFRTIILRHFRSEWGKLVLSVLGVAIGVAVFVAIRLANTTAFAAFSASIDEVAGKANLQIVANEPGGFDEALLGRVRDLAAVRAAAPVIEQYGQIIDSSERADPGTGAPVLLFGVDPFAEGAFRSYRAPRSRPADPESAGDAIGVLRPGTAVVTTVLAGRLRLGIGDTLRVIAGGRRLALEVVGTTTASGPASALGGSFALLDIATAQELLDRVGRLDRIDLIVPDRQEQGVASYLQSMLPPDVRATRPAQRNEQTLRMLDAFDLNLTALAFIALFVSMFIVYNTMLTSILRRRRELGILRAVGTRRATIVALVLSEAAVIGIAGSAIGVALGIVLARGALDQVLRSVSALYILAVARELTIDPATLMLGAGLGIAASVLSALAPALEAARVHPRETFAVQALESRVRLNYTRVMAASLVALAGALIASLRGQATMSPFLGFAGAALVLIGFALLTPALLTAGNALFGGVVRRLFGVEGELATAYLVQSLGRASTAIAALMTAIAMLIGVSTMVGSFRATVDLWMRQTVTADLYLTVSTNRLTPAAVARIPEEVVRFADSLPEVASADAVRRRELSYAGRTVTLNGARLNVPRGERSLTFEEGSWEEAVRAMNSGAATVSESFSRRFAKGMGDTIVVATPDGPRPLTIAGIYYDYTTDAGAIMMRREVYARMFRDSAITHVALYLRDPSQLEPVRRALERRFAARYSLIVYTNRTLRDQVLDIFDQTFAITYALQIVAMLVAAIGVANTLAALVVERSREIGILKAIGATAGQVRGMTLVQAGLIGLSSQILGTIAGLLLSAILIYVINRVSFGWTIQLRISPEVLGGSAALVLLTSFVAGIIPAGQAARKAVAEVVRAE